MALPVLRRLATRSVPVSSAPSGPVRAATASVNYNTPGQPLRMDWDAKQATEQGYFQSVYVYRCIRTIADTIGALPFRVGKDPNEPQGYDVEAPMAKLLGPAPYGPNVGSTARTLWAWSIVQFLISGRWAWEYQKTSKGSPPIGLWPLVSSYVSPIPSTGGTAWWDKFKYDLPTGARELTPDQIFYAWRPSARDWRQPESVLESARLPISVAIGLDRYQWALLKNNMVAAHIVISPPFDEPDMRRAWQEQFVSEFTGFDNAGKTIFAEAENDYDTTGKLVDQAKVQVLPLAQTAENAQLVRISNEAKIDITIALGVPISLIGNASERTYANAAAEYRNFWTITVLPLLAELQDYVNNFLAPQFDDDLLGWFDLSHVVALQPPTPLIMPAQVSDLVANNIASAAEIAELLGLSGQVRPEDTSTSEVGEESSVIGAGGQVRSRSLPLGWRWESRGLNTTTLQNGTSWKLAFDRPRIEVRSVESRGSETATAVLDRVEEMRSRRLETRAGVCTGDGPCDVTPQGPGPNWVTKVDGLPLYIRAIARALRRAGHSESEAIAMAVGIVKRWAAGEGKVTPATRARAAAAVGEWERKKAQADSRSMAVTEAGSGAPLMPRGQPIPPKPRQATSIGPHRFVGSSADKCAVCGKSYGAKVHTGGKVTEKRHRGPDGHQGVSTGHVAGNPQRSATAHRKRFSSDAKNMQDQMTQVLQGVMRKASKATVERMVGKRGTQMRARAQSNQTAFDPSLVFNETFWAQNIAQAVLPVYAAMTALVASRIGDMVDLDGVDTTVAQAMTTGALQQRAEALGRRVGEATLDRLRAQMDEGEGETFPQLAERIKSVFDEAVDGSTPDEVPSTGVPKGTPSTAKSISEAEVPSAINEAAAAYVASLPTPMNKTWITGDNPRPAHIAANGQTVNSQMPFKVGGYKLMHPGARTAPPSEWAGCNCSVAYSAA